MEHPDWDNTIQMIKAEGGKPAIGEFAEHISVLHSRRLDWINDKIRSKFAFPALCWERSYIPRLIWMAGESTTNLIESLHADANREGVACSLVGGYHKGRRFDVQKEKSLLVTSFACSAFIH
jgi:hypothetical protein